MIFKPRARLACLWIFLMAGFGASGQRSVTVVRRPGAPVFSGSGVNRLFIPVKQGGLWGYADTSRHILIAPQFDAANPFYDNVAVVEKKQKAYAIDTTGKILTPGFDQLIVIEDTMIFFYV